MDKNDLDALRAAYRGVTQTAHKLLQLEAAVDRAASATVEDPPADLIRVATAHAIAAAAFSGLLHRLFTPGGVAPAKPELTDSAGESAT